MRELMFPCGPRHLTAIIYLALGACTASEAPFRYDGGPWTSPLGLSHPLAGRVWLPAKEEFSDSHTLLLEMSEADYVILGEKHDNPDHHRIQAWTVSNLFARGRRPALAFEMFTTEQAEALRAYIAGHPRDAAGLGPALGWNQSGWPDWRHYQPIAQAVLSAGAPILAANLARPMIQAISKEGTKALGPQIEDRLALRERLPLPLAAEMRREIVEAHCNQLPESMIAPMTTVMRARDANMADVLLRGAEIPGRDSAVLIAGKGHARRDYGVPYHLARLAPGRTTVSLALVEVAEGEDDPRAYAARFNSQVLPYDFVWFTPRPAREPACERFADQLRRAKERHQKEGQSN